MKSFKEQSAGYLINHVARLFARGLTARIKPLGLTTGTFPALLELWDQDGLTQKKLVARLDIEQATMANTLNRMDRDGLVIRRKDPSDGRAQRVWLTDRVRSLKDAAIAAAIEENAASLAGAVDHRTGAFHRSDEKGRAGIETRPRVIAGPRAVPGQSVGAFGSDTIRWRIAQSSATRAQSQDDWSGCSAVACQKGLDGFVHHLTNFFLGEFQLDPQHRPYPQPRLAQF